MSGNSIIEQKKMCLDLGRDFVPFAIIKPKKLQTGNFH